ncbi:hypothetical protein CspHIS471_0300020 [Cutaneotrichosporon sp. HIS471]|nr:hypothetical protein CspHIS471_0300020 [Cutaneotrichosporon sp. HIS471]
MTIDPNNSIPLITEDVITGDKALKGVLPPDFAYAASTASFQIEGGWDQDGKGPGIWDVYLHENNMDNGDDAVNSYNLWREDIKLLKQYGVNTYRFSISWPRVKPLGGKDDPVNEKGIEYYSNLVDALLAEGITPFVTIFHWDTPYELQKRYGEFENPDKLVDDFVAYARVLFERLGDRVTNWITINEPVIYMMFNIMGMKANTWTEDTSIAYTKSLLLSHARTVDLYRREFKPKQGGQIGITLNVDYVVPIDDSPSAIEAAQDSLDQMFGQFADPIYHGYFPESMYKRFDRTKLNFTPEEWAIVKGSNDFFGLNHYSTFYATGEVRPLKGASGRDRALGLEVRVAEKNGVPIGRRGENGHPYDVAWGFRLLIQYIDKRYLKSSGHRLYITENGYAVDGETKLEIDQAVEDKARQSYYAGYIREAVLARTEDGIDIAGYMAWSLMDNLEWLQGYRSRFGITCVDRSSPNFTRTPKESAFMLKRVFDYLISKE